MALLSSLCQSPRLPTGIWDHLWNWGNASRYPCIPLGLPLAQRWQPGHLQQPLPCPGMAPGHSGQTPAVVAHPRELITPKSPPWALCVPEPAGTLGLFPVGMGTADQPAPPKCLLLLGLHCPTVPPLVPSSSCPGTALPWFLTLLSSPAFVPDFIGNALAQPCPGTALPWSLTLLSSPAFCPWFFHYLLPWHSSALVPHPALNPCFLPLILLAVPWHPPEPGQAVILARSRRGLQPGLQNTLTGRFLITSSFSSHSPEKSHQRGRDGSSLRHFTHPDILAYENLLHVKNDLWLFVPLLYTVINKNIISRDAVNLYLARVFLFCLK